MEYGRSVQVVVRVNVKKRRADVERAIEFVGKALLAQERGPRVR
jgi:hypothetical protein